MNIATVLLLAALFIAVGASAYLFGEARRWRQTAAEEREEGELRRDELEEAKRDAIRGEAETAKHREIAAVQLRMLTDTQRQLESRFREMAAETLQNNSQHFLDRSREQLQHLVEPVGQSLLRFEKQVGEIEKLRIGAYADLTAQVQSLTSLQERVRQSTDQLKTALRSPSQRGRWGEMQLRRVVELAGMLEYCDFSEQETLFGETRQRPDLIVRLPNQCRIVIDAKVSLEAYLRGIEAQEDSERVKHFSDHARQIRTHVKSLGDKAYWQRLNDSPDFVVAFLPLESLFSAALEHDPMLLDFGVEHRVILATPVTLITLLLVVAHGWRQQTIAEGIEKIRDSGSELYGRVLKMSEHFEKLGDAIEKTVTAYNATVGSLEKNVLTSARKLRDLRPVHAAQVEEPKEVEPTPRRLDPSKWRMLETAELQRRISTD